MPAERSVPTGPVDVIGDVHGCYDELCALLDRLDHAVHGGGEGARVVPPAGRTALFLGDLIDRGPRAPAVVRLVMDMVADGAASCLLGNHEHQYLEHLAGRAPVAWGLAETLAQLAAEPPELGDRLRRFAAGLPWKLVLDEGRCLVAHAGLPAELQGEDSERARNFALYGTPAGTRRRDWAAGYRGAARVVYGHTPTDDPTWVHGTICIDTGCVFGGRLTALRYPELELVSVAARRRYYAGG